MSYEGVNHKLCANGHYSAADAVTEMYDMVETECSYCHAPITHEFAQDCTNGDDPESPRTLAPDLGPFQIDAAKGKTCDLGHFHMSEPSRYRVPNNKLWRKVGSRVRKCL